MRYYVWSKGIRLFGFTICIDLHNTRYKQKNSLLERKNQNADNWNIDEITMMLKKKYKIGAKNVCRIRKKATKLYWFKGVKWFVELRIYLIFIKIYRT